MRGEADFSVPAWGAYKWTFFSLYFLQSKSRKGCWYAWAVRGQPLCLPRFGCRRQANRDGRRQDIARWEVKRGNCGDEILLWLSGAICTWRREERRRGGSPLEESFEFRCLLANEGWAAHMLTLWQRLPRQAPLHLHTECVPLYLFIHFHVAKCCHFDEWEMEPANCFHSTGQVSHALNLNVLLVLRSNATLCLLEAAAAAAATSHTRVHRRTWRALRSFFLIRLYLRSWGCSLRFHLCRSGCFTPAARKPSERLEPNPVGRVEVVSLVPFLFCWPPLCVSCNALCVALCWVTVTWDFLWPNGTKMCSVLPVNMEHPEQKVLYQDIIGWGLWRYIYGWKKMYCYSFCCM